MRLMRCSHPDCTGVHDNNRYRELCPRSLEKKRDKDLSYHMTTKGVLKRVRSNASRRGYVSTADEEVFRVLPALDRRIDDALARGEPMDLLAIIKQMIG